MQSLSFMSLSVWVWLNEGRIAASPLNATTFFPNPGWLHWSALPWAEEGLAQGLPWSPGQNPSPPLGYLGAVFSTLFLFSPVLPKIIKELKDFCFFVGRSHVNLTYAWLFAAGKRWRNSRRWFSGQLLWWERRVEHWPSPCWLDLELTSASTPMSHPVPHLQHHSF